MLCLKLLKNCFLNEELLCKVAHFTRSYIKSSNSRKESKEEKYWYFYLFHLQPTYFIAEFYHLFIIIGHVTLQKVKAHLMEHLFLEQNEMLVILITLKRATS